MKQPWTGKIHLPVLAAIFCVLIAAFFLHGENLRRIQEEKATAISETVLPSSVLEEPINNTTNIDINNQETDPNKKQSVESDGFDWSNRNENDENDQKIGRNKKQSNDSGFDWSQACVSTRNRTLVDEGSHPRPESDLGNRSGNGDLARCDVFSGKWVFDSSYPLYSEGDCPYMSDQLACRKYGRPDSDYQKWRWQPHNCYLKRWNASEMLEKLRGKRLMFVGDSLNRGQWISMVCLLQSALSTSKKSMSPNAALTVFRAEEYNATVEFYWAPLLVESNSDDPVNHRFNDRIIRPNSLLKHTSHWEHADILVFNSYLWWRRGPKLKLLWRSSEGGVCEESEGLEAMKLALDAWANWVASNVNPLTTRVFFVTMSPTHLWSQEWQSQSKGNCWNETIPIDNEVYWGSGSDLRMMSVVENVLRSLGSKVSVLNITQLSEYRKDGHPSVYRKFWETMTPQKLSNPVSYADCIHWCLPGVPDVWNELLFNFL